MGDLAAGLPRWHRCVEPNTGWHWKAVWQGVVTHLEARDAIARPDIPVFDAETVVPPQNRLGLKHFDRAARAGVLLHLRKRLRVDGICRPAVSTKDIMAAGWIRMAPPVE